MAGVGRNLSLAALLIAVLAVGAVLLPSPMWACALAVLLGLAGVVLFRGNRWRTSALMVAALALSLAVLDAFAGLLSPTAINYGLVKTTVPRWWPPPDPILGFRPAPNSEVLNTATFGPELLYRRTYHFDADAARVTPQAPAGADTYLFLGDSFIFGQGLPDDETLAAQFGKADGLKVRTVNLGVPGNAPNHLVRAFEAGLLDRYASQPVKAVVTWIIPAQLARVTGDGSWLGSSPRYVLENGKLRHTGTFDEYRLRHPLVGAKYLLGELFPFVDAIGMKQRQDEQVELFVAMMVRLQQYSREKFGAPFIVIYSWPDETSSPGHGESEFAQPMLAGVIERLRKLGIPLISVDHVTSAYDVSQLLIPHDGHPNAFTTDLIAAELKRFLKAQ
ncbi:MAG: hypothetical protein ACXWLB_12620 [Reyranella sp.]